MGSFLLRKEGMRVLTAIFIVILLISCERSVKPEQINYGADSCDYCRMIIADAGFSAQLKTKKGKVYKFDSIECLAAFVLSKRVKEEEILAMWVADFANKDSFIRVEKAKFLVSENLRSPMGLNISAYSSEEDLQKAFRNFGGTVMSWEEVLSYVRKRWGKRLSR